MTVMTMKATRLKWMIVRTRTTTVTTVHYKGNTFLQQIGIVILNGNIYEEANEFFTEIRTEQQ